MKGLISVFFMAIIGQCAMAQQITIVSSSDGEVVPYANILFLKNDSAVGGTYSNAIGVVEFNPSDGYDAIEISHVLYESVRVELKEFEDTIILKENQQVLEEVSVVAPKTQKTIYIGYKPKKFIRGSRISADLGYEMVTLISNIDSLDKLVKSFVLYTYKSEGTKSSKLKVVFYKNEKNSPSEKLPVEIIVVLDTNIKEKITIDLREHQIMLPKEGIFAGIEWLGCGDNEIKKRNEPITMCNRSVALKHYNKKKEGSISFVRYKLDWNKWVKIEDPESRLMGGYFIPVFGLEVYD